MSNSEHPYEVIPQPACVDAVAWARAKAPLNEDQVRMRLDCAGLSLGVVWASDGKVMAWVPAPTGVDIPHPNNFNVRPYLVQAESWPRGFALDYKAAIKVCRTAIKEARERDREALAEWRAKPKLSASALRALPSARREVEKRRQRRPEPEYAPVVILSDGTIIRRGSTPGPHPEALVCLDARRMLPVLQHARPTKICIRSELDPVGFFGGACDAILMPMRL